MLMRTAEEAVEHSRWNARQKENWTQWKEEVSMERKNQIKSAKWVQKISLAVVALLWREEENEH